MRHQVIRILHLVLSLGFYVAWWLWRSCVRVVGRTPAGTCVALYYHAVPTHERQRFAQQMDMLLRVAKPVAADFTVPPADGSHNVAVTFDDGFRSVIDNALPELAQRDIPATLFIPSGCLGQHPPWLQNRVHTDAHETILTSTELQAIASALVTVGSHTVTHRNLLSLSHTDVTTELRQSRTKLSELCATEVRLLSFPHGAYDHHIVQLSQQAGYTRVFTTLPTLVDPTAYVVGRVNACPRDWPLEFYLKVHGAYRWLPFAFSVKRQLRSMLHFHRPLMH